MSNRLSSERRSVLPHVLLRATLEPHMHPTGRNTSRSSFEVISLLQQLSWEEVEALQPYFKVTPALSLLLPHALHDLVELFSLEAG